MKDFVFDHLVKFLGEPARIARREGNVDVVLWPEPTSVDLMIMCTVGMSCNSQLIPKGLVCASREPRTELLCYSYSGNVDIMVDLLMNLSRYPFEKSTFVFWWQTMSLGRPIMRGSKLNSLLLSLPPFEADQITFSIDDKRVDLLWVVPISELELNYAQIRGFEALEEALMSTDVDVANMFREDAIRTGI